MLLLVEPFIHKDHLSIEDEIEIVLQLVLNSRLESSI